MGRKQISDNHTLTANSLSLLALKATVILPKNFARRSNCGFTYVMVLAAVVIVGILAEVAHITTWRIMKAEREAELLFRGQAYRRAIESFYKSNGRFPRSLEDLVKDPGSSSRRHLRMLYLDPMAEGEKRDWLLVRGKDGGISGVTSSAADEPLKQANFPKEFEKFASAKSYKDWIFEYAPQAAPQLRPQSPPPPGAAPPVLKTF